MFDKYSRKSRMKKAKVAKGEALKPIRAWDYLARTIFHIKIEEDVYSIEVDLFGDDWDGAESALYINHKRVRQSRTPSVYEVPGGFIEVETTAYGVKRMHYVTDASEIQLTPDKKSPEGMRANLKRKFPIVSRIIDITSIVILIIGLIVGIPAVIDLITDIPAVSVRVGDFTSPFQFLTSLNITLFVLGIIAATERALSLKNHWLIDMDTNTYDF